MLINCNINLFYIFHAPLQLKFPASVPAYDHFSNIRSLSVYLSKPPINRNGTLHLHKVSSFNMSYHPLIALIPPQTFDCIFPTEIKY